MKRPVLFVGEANPYGPNPSFALYDLPEGTSGHRLRTKVLGLSREAYRGPHVARVNLCSTTFDRKEARRLAAEIIFDARDYSLVVLLGGKVRDTFGLGLEFFASNVVGGITGTPFALLPHPSGLSRAWNDPSSVLRARTLLSGLCDLPFGEIDG